MSHTLTLDLVSGVRTGPKQIAAVAQAQVSVRVHALHLNGDLEMVQDESRIVTVGEVVEELLPATTKEGIPCAFEVDAVDMPLGPGRSKKRIHALLGAETRCVQRPDRQKCTVGPSTGSRILTLYPLFDEPCTWRITEMGVRVTDGDPNDLVLYDLRIGRRSPLLSAEPIPWSAIQKLGIQSVFHPADFQGCTGGLARFTLGAKRACTFEGEVTFEKVATT